MQWLLDFVSVLERHTKDNLYASAPGKTFGDSVVLAGTFRILGAERPKDPLAEGNHRILKLSEPTSGVVEIRGTSLIII